MKISYTEDKIIINNPSDFNLKHTFDCGQCFRFSAFKKGYSGVAFKKRIYIYEEEGNIVIENLTFNEFESSWKGFFDLQRDYGKIKDFLISDEIMKKAIDYGWGIRILKQEFFECLISFIISQQNNIPRIKKAVEGFAKLFGEEKEYMGEKYYTFPDAQMVKSITEKDLEPLKLGYRNSYIIGAIKEVAEGRLSYDALAGLSYDEAKKKLLSVRGIGNKVADCILLFSLGKFEAFPVDTWIKKAMHSLYGVKEKDIPDYKNINYKDYSGFAQQYIFYYARNNQQ